MVSVWYVVNQVGFSLLAFSTWPAGSASVLSQHHNKIVSAYTVYLLGGLLTYTHGTSRKMISASPLFFFGGGGVEINFSFTLYLN